MSLGLIGKKQGMTRIFTEEGKSLPVTVINIEPNTVTQLKTVDSDGYFSIQVTTGSRKEKHLKKSELGHFKKSSVNPGEGLWEFRVNEEDMDSLEVGKVIPLNFFKEGQVIDVSGISKGKGFAGTVKRWNFKMQDATHGNSLSHRAPGSIGQCQTPGRVWKGKKMSGHMGSERVTVQNLKIVVVDEENNLILIKGAVPGFTGSRVVLKPARNEEIDFSFNQPTEATEPELTEPEPTEATQATEPEPTEATEPEPTEATEPEPTEATEPESAEEVKKDKEDSK